MPARVHVLASQKGGVGKTTLAMNLAAVTYDAIAAPGPLYLATAEEHGDPQSPICVASTDPQASSVWWSRRIERRGAGLPFDFFQITNPEQLNKLKYGRYQHIFIDTPGSLTDEENLQEALEICDDVLVPITPQPLSWDPTALTIEQVIEPLGVPYRVVINDWDPRDGLTDLQKVARYVVDKQWPRCRTVIRHYKVHSRASADGQVVTQYPKNRVSFEARQDFNSLALELGFGGQLAVPLDSELTALTGNIPAQPAGVVVVGP